MKKFTHTLLCCLLLLFSTGMYAQKGLQIASVFQKYGNEKGATYVELSKMLSKNWDIPLPKPETDKGRKSITGYLPVSGIRPGACQENKRGGDRRAYSIGILPVASGKR